MACNQQRCRGWLSLFGGLLVYSTLGTIYTYGNLTTYVTSYVRVRSSPRTLRYIDSEWMMALALMGQGGFMFVGGLISLKIGPRLTTFLGCTTMSVGVVLTYWTIRWSFYASLVTYGILFGAGLGIAYAPPLWCAMQWYPNHKGLVNGISLAGFGGAAFVFDQIQTYFINPDNKTPDQPVSPGSSERYFSEAQASDVLDRVPYCFLLLGGVYWCLQILGCLLLTTPSQPEDLICNNAERDPILGKDDENSSSLTSPKLPVVEDIPPTKMLRTKSFYLIWLMFFFNGQSVIFISSLYKQYGQTFISDDRFLAIVGAIASIFNAAGRISWGRLADKTSFRTSMVCLCGLMSIFMLTFIAAPSTGRVFYVVWVAMLFFIFSGTFALIPTAIAKTFGPKYLSVNFGLAFTSQVVTGAVGALLTSNIAKIFGWFGMFCLIAGFSFISMVIAFVFNVRSAEGGHV